METDDEQLEKLRLWWKENGAFVVIGVALGFTALFGWRWWGDYQESTYMDASSRYERLLQSEQEGMDIGSMISIVEELRSTRIWTPYADMAALEVARRATVDGDLGTATHQLQQVLDGTRDETLAHTARLRLVRVMLATGDHGAAERLLGVRDTGAYAPLYGELRGDLALARGDRERAVEEYRAALAGAVEGIADRAVLEIKLDDLGVTPAGAES